MQIDNFSKPINRRFLLDKLINPNYIFSGFGARVSKRGVSGHANPGVGISLSRLHEKACNHAQRYWCEGNRFAPVSSAKPADRAEFQEY